MKSYVTPLILYIFNLQQNQDWHMPTGKTGKQGIPPPTPSVKTDQHNLSEKYMETVSKFVQDFDNEFQ
jgi:hypothetical protein